MWDVLLWKQLYNNHDYRYQNKQPWKQFYCLDNTIRTLPANMVYQLFTDETEHNQN